MLTLLGRAFFNFSPRVENLSELVPRSNATREALLPKKDMWHLYIINKNGKYYTGITTDLKNRMRQHDSPPLLYKETFPNKFRAAQREKQIKGWSKAKKEDLIAKFNR